MRLSRVSVRKYRSIDQAANFQVDDFTVLLGPNNKGKSNLLRAAVLAMQIIERWARLPQTPRYKVPVGIVSRFTPRSGRLQGSEPIGYEWERDFPLFARGRRGAKQSTVIHLDFKLDAQEQNDFKAATKMSTNENLPIEISLDQQFVGLRVRKPGKGDHDAKAKEIARFIADRISLVHIPAVRTGVTAQGITGELLTARRRQILAEADGGKLLEKLDEVDRQAVEQVEAELQATMMTFVPEISNVELSVRALSRTSGLEDILIDDGVKTPIATKGDGIQSLVALALTLEWSRASTGSKKQLIVAVEEPESHLHPGAVRELREVLQGIAAEQQVIVTTHSQALVNRVNIHHNVVVSERTAKQAGTLADLRGALGVMLADALAANEVTVVVEGFLDEQVLLALLRSRYPKSRAWLDDGRVIVESAGSGNKIHARALAARTILTEPVVMIDGDGAGEADVAKLLAGGFIDSSAVVKIRRPGCAHSELEDVFRLDAYIEAIEPRLGFSLSSRQRNRLDKGRDLAWSERLEGILLEAGVPDVKGDVRRAKHDFAESILRKLAEGEQVLRPESEAMFDRLFGIIENRLTR